MVSELKNDNKQRSAASCLKIRFRASVLAGRGKHAREIVHRHPPPPPPLPVEGRGAGAGASESRKLVEGGWHGVGGGDMDGGNNGGMAAMIVEQHG